MMISIRRMTAADVPAAQSLLSQLGHRMEIADVRRHFDVVDRSADHAAMVAADDGQVIALCHMYARPALDKPPEAVMQALVVDRATRGLGVGKMLMAAAEAWAAVCGFSAVTLGSHVSQPDAYAFYESFGYRSEAALHATRKPVSVPP